MTGERFASAKKARSHHEEGQSLLIRIFIKVLTDEDLRLEGLCWQPKPLIS